MRSEFPDVVSNFRAFCYDDHSNRTDKLSLFHAELHDSSTPNYLRMFWDTLDTKMVYHPSGFFDEQPCAIDCWLRNYIRRNGFAYLLDALSCALQQIPCLGNLLDKRHKKMLHGTNAAGRHPHRPRIF